MTTTATKTLHDELNDLGKLYEAAVSARWPVSEEITAPEFWRCWLAAAFFTGLRPLDLLSLQWENIGDGMVRVVAVKTNRVHCIPIHPLLKVHFGGMRGHDESRVFPVWPDGLDLLRDELRRLSETAGVYVSLASIRQLAAKAFEDAAKSAGAVLLGHTPSRSDGVPETLTAAVSTLQYPDAFDTYDLG